MSDPELFDPYSHDGKIVYYMLKLHLERKKDVVFFRDYEVLVRQLHHEKLREEILARLPETKAFWTRRNAEAWAFCP